MAGWLMLAQAIVAASGPVPVASVEQAKAMPPQALAEALLGPGHPPVDFANVAPVDMAPPPPPGAPPQFWVVLQTAPAPAGPGFCARTAINLRVLDPGPAARVEVDRTRTLHRLGAKCAGGRAAYGDYRDGAARDAVRALAVLQRRKRVSIPVTFVDEMPADFRIERYRDGAAALRAVPLTEVS